METKRAWERKKRELEHKKKRHGTKSEMFQLQQQQTQRYGQNSSKAKKTAWSTAETDENERERTDNEWKFYMLSIHIHYGVIVKVKRYVVDCFSIWCAYFSPFYNSRFIQISLKNYISRVCMRSFHLFRVFVVGFFSCTRKISLFHLFLSFATLLYISSSH